MRMNCQNILKRVFHHTYLSLAQGRGNVLLPSPVCVTLRRAPVAPEVLQQEPLRPVQARPLPEPEYGQTSNPNYTLLKGGKVNLKLKLLLKADPGRTSRDSGPTVP